MKNKIEDGMGCAGLVPNASEEVLENQIDQSVRLACENYRNREKLLIAFIREIAASNSPEGLKAKAKLKEWNLPLS